MKWIAIPAFPALNFRALGCLALGLLTLALPAAAELYKWVDAQGKVHYSDQPPPPNVKPQKAPAAPRTPAPAAAPAAEGKPAAAPAAGPKTAAEQEMEFRKRRVEAAEAEAKRQQETQAAAEKQRNCQQAMNRVAVLQTGGRITKPGPTGEQIYMGDSEIASELVEARRVADSWCK